MGRVTARQSNRERGRVCLYRTVGCKRGFLRFDKVRAVRVRRWPAFLKRLRGAGAGGGAGRYTLKAPLENGGALA